MEKATVYFTKDLSAKGLMKAYNALGVQLKGKVAVKISTGEPGGHNFLQPALIQDLVKALNGTIVECNTAYGGRRSSSEEHWKAIEEHGFKAIAPCDIMDEEGDMAIPVTGGKHLKENYVGTHLKNYDSILMLSHFKGHAMAGQMCIRDRAYTSATYSDQAVDGYTLASYRTVDNRGFNLPAVPAGTDANGRAVGNDFTADVRVRRAINIGIDRQEMIDNVLNGYGTPAYSICDQLPWYNPASEVAYLSLIHI